MGDVQGGINLTEERGLTSYFIFVLCIFVELFKGEKHGYRN